MHLDLLELVVVKRLQGTIHTDVEQSVAILQDAVYIVARHAHVGFRLFLDDLELIAIIFIQSIAGSNPDKPVTVLIDLTGETTRQLFVGIKQFTYLCI